jgi:uncharacterized repeat protein (TIGR03803 family)
MSHVSRMIPLQRNLRAAVSTLALALTLVLVATLAAQAQTFKVIHDFTGGADGANPYAGLARVGANSFYGTADFGGTAGQGVVFLLTPSGSNWSLTPIYSFQGGLDGAQPFSAITVGPDGALYGVTENGGGFGCNGVGCGTVYSLHPSATICRTAKCAAWKETLLVQFQGGDDGGDPYGALIFDQAGTIYGATQIGGTSQECIPQGIGCGTAYSLARNGNTWTKTVIWNFGQGLGGIEPFNGLVRDNSGNLYGTTFVGGQHQEGTVYQLTHGQSGWTENDLYSFQGANDGGLPYVGLIFDQAGNLYGAASDAGTGAGGTVFEVTHSGSNWIYNTLYGLTDPSGAECGPFGTLVMDAAGNLYGTTRCDGVNHAGSVFKLTKSGNTWTYTSLHDFTGGADGGNPYSSLVFDANGNIYGTASRGGVSNQGVVFEITP